MGNGWPVLGSVRPAAPYDIRLTIFSASSGEGGAMTSLDGVSLLIVLRMDMPNSLLELLVIIALSDCGFLVDRLVIVFVHYQASRSFIAHVFERSIKS